MNSDYNINNDDIIVGLDIGTSKVCVLIVATDSSRKSLNILGLGLADSDGLRRGVIVNIDKAVRSIQQAVTLAEQQAGIKVKDVVVGIAGDHIQSFATRSIISISNPTKEISHSDVQRLLEEARRIAIPSDRRILHVIPQDYIIDGQDGITDPIGMSGVRMEANVHIVTALVTAMQNIHRCVERAGLTVSDLVLEPLASSAAVLDDDEKEVGVALIDIGGGTTDVAVFVEGIIRHTAVFAIGGHQVTDDICNVLGILSVQAERIKREYGHALQESIMRDEVFMIPGIGGRKPLEVTKSLLCQVIQPRMEEIFEFAYAEIKKSGYADRLFAGVIVTGGSALLRGTDELAHNVFGRPVKIGIPSAMSYGGLAPEVESPMFATAVGLVMHGLRARNHTVDESTEDVVPKKPSLFKKVKSFFEEL